MVVGKVYVLLLCLVLLWSCSTKPKATLSQEKVEDVYLELQLLEEYTYLNDRNLPKEEMSKKQAERRQEIYKYYQTDSTEFFSSLEAYSKDKEVITNIFESVQGKLDSMRTISKS